MPEIVCIGCGTTVTGARQRRRCTPCRRKNSTAVIRTLAPGEQIPAHKPQRYLSDQGYVRVRWRVGVRQYVETYEHRIVGTRVTAEEHVHHVNLDRADNRPSNLRPLSAAEHYAIHRSPDWWGRAADMYATGLSTYQIGKSLTRNPASVYRALVKLGVPLRKEARVAVPHREQNRS